jgi:hypothetical protein
MNILCIFLPLTLLTGVGSANVLLYWTGVKNNSLLAYLPMILWFLAGDGPCEVCSSKEWKTSS